MGSKRMRILELEHEVREANLRATLAEAAAEAEFMHCREMAEEIEELKRQNALLRSERDDYRWRVQW